MTHLDAVVRQVRRNLGALSTGGTPAGMQPADPATSGGA